MSFQPEVYGKYYLVDRIAVGGMAEIFKAKIFGPGGFEKLLVIKRILLHLSQNEDFVDMFMDEARISSTLTHSNIIHIFDFGKIKDNYFIAMEYLDGRDLKTLMKKCQKVGRPLPLDYAVYVVHEMCKALDHAHHKKDSQNRELNILHRDISPSNVLISYDEGRVKLADFGIAKAEGATYKTQAGVLKGKFEYMSPEQASGRPMDRRSDVFATGIVLYELLTRRRLFKAGSDLETLEMIRNPKVPPPSHLNPEIPRELDAIVMKALAPNPEERYQEAWELQRDLRAFMRPNSPDVLAQNLAGLLKELFQKEIDEESERLERGSRLIREAIRTGSMAEEIALEDTFGQAEDSSFDHPSTQISFEVASGKERKRLSALIFVLAAVALISGALYWMEHSQPEPQVALVVAPKPPAQPPPVAAPTFGTLTITSEPANANVFLEGELIGAKTPLTYEKVPIGKTVWLDVEAPGFKPQRRPIVMPADSPLAQHQFVLEPDTEPQKQAARPATPATSAGAAPRPVGTAPTAALTEPARPSGKGGGGSLEFVSIPAGAEVYVDGRRICRTPCEFAATEPDQKVKLAYAMAGWETWTSTMSVPGGERLQVSAKLARAEMGKLSVTFKEPAQVEILVDGLRHGFGVMISGIPLTAGQHEITLRNPALGIKKTLTVQVKAGELTEVTGVDLRN